ncbi:hypothetical protein CYY_008924 [Polysphondylium violaceum]|uniref:Uncharacterized protein n=1 Tax=Polysphondylium violaceum TaxID=133409 RepID=A0A8J4PKV4_9MYCE|nr:hypothetical protein CYY_008924 [Polysphondylium violaceum]
MKLDLSAYQSIKELSVHGDSIINYPPNIETLDLQLKDDENYEHYDHGNSNGVEEEYQFNFEKLLDLLTFVLGRDFYQDLNDNLPSSLTELVLNRHSSHPILRNLHCLVMMVYWISYQQSIIWNSIETLLNKNR